MCHSLLTFLAMLSKTTAALVVLFLASIPVHSSEDKKDDCITISTDVAIVGGGAAGTYAAIQLFDQGVDVVVVERQSDLGGHADTYTDPTTGKVLNAGVQLLHNSTLVRQYGARLGVPLEKPSFDVNTTTLAVDFKKGQETANPMSDPGTYTALAQYLEILTTTYPYLAKGFHLPDPVPKDLLLSFGDFATKHGIEKAVFLLNQYTQGWDISKVPALYALMLASSELVGEILAGGDFLTTEDINDLYRSAAAILGSRVLFNSNIQSVQRYEAGVIVKVRQKNGAVKTIKANKLLMTGAPLLDNLKGWDLTREERDLFSKFDTFGYFAGVVSNADFPEATSFTNVESNTTFHTPELPALFNVGNTPFPNKARTVYYATHPDMDSDMAAQKCLADIDGLVRTLGYGTAKTKLLAWYPHGPFSLEVSADEIRRGFYKRLYALQGVKRTWWGGATFSAQDSAQIWQNTRDTVIGPLSVK